MKVLFKGIFGIMLIICACGVLKTHVYAQDTADIDLVVNTARASIRSEMRERHSAIAFIAWHGDILQAVEQKGKWYRIELISGEPRWIQRMLVRPLRNHYVKHISEERRKRFYADYKQAVINVRERVEEHFYEDDPRYDAAEQAWLDEEYLRICRRYSVSTRIGASIIEEWKNKDQSGEVQDE